jgi:hypothetical protein
MGKLSLRKRKSDGSRKSSASIAARKTTGLRIATPRRPPEITEDNIRALEKTLKCEQSLLKTKIPREKIPLHHTKIQPWSDISTIATIGSTSSGLNRPQFKRIFKSSHRRTVDWDLPVLQTLHSSK